MLLKFLSDKIVYPYTYQNLVHDFPNTSFPAFSKIDTQLESFGIFKVHTTEQPTYNSIIQYLVEDTPTLGSNGKWHQKWKIVSKFNEYVDDNGVLHTVEEQETNAILIDENNKKELLKINIVNKVQENLDIFARTRGYDNILSACTYANSMVDKFKQEGIYCIEIRDATWNKLYEILADVEAGIRPSPSSYEEISHELPIFNWQN